MRYSLAWSDVLSQNVALRISLAALSVCVIGLLVVLARLAFKEPLIIERECYSTVREQVKEERTESEIKSFVDIALKNRFETDVEPNSSLLSAEELSYREQEQKELKERGISQRILINRVKNIEENQITVDCDRIVSIGDVRSAFSFPLTVTLSSVRRTQINAYGLRITKVKPIQSEKKNEK